MKKGTLTIVGASAAAAAVALAVARRRVEHAPLVALEGGEHGKVETSDGAVLDVHIAGEGPSVVLSHCWTGDMRIWEPVAAELVGRGHRVIRYDQRGHGGSTVGAGGCTVQRLGDDLAELLAALDVRDAVVAGHSMGGMTAQAFAIDHADDAAERVRALVLVSTASRNTSVPGLRRLGQLFLTSPRVEWAMGTRYGHALVRRSLGKGASPAAVRATRDTFIGTAPQVRYEQGMALLDMDLREGRRSIALPTTVMVGTRDTITPPRHAKGIAADVPGARLVVLPGKGHMLPLEATTEVADRITEAAA